jgi:small subunit ribosomal protein S17
MTENTQQNAKVSHRKQLIGLVVSNRMQKTIVVETKRQSSHYLYGRVVTKKKKFYAHDEKGEAHIGDFVRIEESRPLSRLKRWQLKEIIRRAALVPEISTTVEEVK